jgi:hypothetical protein
MERRWHHAQVEERISSDQKRHDDFLIVESRVFALFCDPGVQYVAKKLAAFSGL